jgi:hypothetical protein
MEGANALPAGFPSDLAIEMTDVAVLASFAYEEQRKNCN